MTLDSVYFLPALNLHVRWHKGKEQRRDEHSMDTARTSLPSEVLSVVDHSGGPTEIRTRVSAVRGQRPWPLDDGALLILIIPGQGFEPRFYGPEPHVLPVGRPRSDRLYRKATNTLGGPY